MQRELDALRDGVKHLRSENDFAVKELKACRERLSNARRELDVADDHPHLLKAARHARQSHVAQRLRRHRARPGSRHRGDRILSGFRHSPSLGRPPRQRVDADTTVSTVTARQ